METTAWPPPGFQWEPIGKNGLCVAVHDSFIWFIGKDGHTTCMTFETGLELAGWIAETIERTLDAKQESSTAEDDARNREWGEAEERRSVQAGGSGLRRSGSR